MQQRFSLRDVGQQLFSAGDLISRGSAHPGLWETKVEAETCIGAMRDVGSGTGIPGDVPCHQNRSVAGRDLRPKNILRGFVRGLGYSAASLLLISRPFCGQAQQSDPQVRTRQGIVAGSVDGPLTVFKAIPYARAPVGELRWRPPLDPIAWKGVRPAVAFAPACMQMPYVGMNIPDQPVSEDCLYLNIWSHKPGAGRLPVIVWIHGGGFSYGSTAMPLFNGAALARRGVVFVSIAYRLGPFGYMAHPELTRESPHHASGNYALLDQIAALRWVHNNIERFGGDPANVTLMGESAGAISAGALIQSPLARGLYQRVIAQSGGSFGPEWGATTTLHDAEAEGIRLAKILGAPDLKSLRAMPADALMRAVPQGAHPFTRMSSLPIIDGYVIPADPLTLYRTRQFDDKPILIGTNELEGALFSPLADAGQYNQAVHRVYGSAADRVLTAYPANNDREAAHSWTALRGDAAFGLPAYTWIESHVRYGASPAFFYHFAHDPPSRPGAKAGPTHGAELPYVFGTLATRNIAWTDADRMLSDNMGTYWVNFAKTGDPNGSGLPVWPRYRSGQRYVLNFGNEKTAYTEMPSLERLRLLSEITLGGANP